MILNTLYANPLLQLKECCVTMVKYFCVDTEYDDLGYISLFLTRNMNGNALVTLL